MCGETELFRLLSQLQCFCTLSLFTTEYRFKQWEYYTKRSYLYLFNWMRTVLQEKLDCLNTILELFLYPVLTSIGGNQKQLKPKNRLISLFDDFLLYII